MSLSEQKTPKYSLGTLPDRIKNEDSISHRSNNQTINTIEWYHSLNHQIKCKGRRVALLAGWLGRYQLLEIQEVGDLLMR